MKCFSLVTRSRASSLNEKLNSISDYRQSGTDLGPIIALIRNSVVKSPIWTYLTFHAMASRISPRKKKRLVAETIQARVLNHYFRCWSIEKFILDQNVVFERFRTNKHVTSATETVLHYLQLWSGPGWRITQRIHRESNSVSLILCIRIESKTETRWIVQCSWCT